MGFIPIRFIHISDSHIDADPGFGYREVNTREALSRAVKAINGLPFVPDFIVHTGDITNRPSEAGYRAAASIFQEFRSPVYFVTGNHDTSALIRQILVMAPSDRGSVDEGMLSYSLRLKGRQFLALDARGPDAIDPHGLLPPSQMELLAREAGQSSVPLSVFIHFPPLPLDSEWLERDMLLLNGMEMHEILVNSRRKIDGVFFGHVHHPMTVVKDGILYSSAGSTCLEMGGLAGEPNAVFMVRVQPSFNIISLVGDEVIIKTCGIPFP